MTTILRIQPQTILSSDYFPEQLQSGVSLKFDPSTASWIPLNWLEKLSNSAFNRFNASNLENITLQFIDNLDLFEQTKLRFKEEDRSLTNKAVIGSVITNSLALLKEWKAGGSLAEQLFERVISLGYRSEITLPEERKEEIPEELKKWASEWKSKQNIIHKNSKPLSEKDLEQLNKAAAFPDYLKVLKVSPKLRDSFFKWTLRDCLDPAPFIQYPGTVGKLRACYLAPRIALFGSDGLQIVYKKSKQIGVVTKRLTIPFLESKDPFNPTQISVLKPTKTILLAHEKKERTIKEIFREFKKNNTITTDLEYLKSGVTHYNSETRFYDLSQPIIPQLEIIRTLSQDDFAQAYNISQEMLEKTVKIYRATRTDIQNLSAEGSHAFLEIAVLNDDGNYEIKSLGGGPDVYPDSTWQLFSSFADTVPNVVRVPDGNDVMLMRQHCAAPFPLSMEEADQLENQVKEIIIDSSAGRIPFQRVGINCARLLQDRFITEPGLQNLFEMNVFETSLPWPLNTLFNLASRCSITAQDKFVRSLVTILGGHRTYTTTEADGNKKVYSVAISSFVKTKTTDIPSRLFKALENGECSGIMWHGPNPLFNRISFEKKLL